MSNPPRPLRVLPWALAAAALGTAIALPGALAWAFLHPPRRLHRRNPKTALGVGYERLRLRSTDGVALSAWLVEHPHPKGLVVLCHGYFGNRETMLPYLEFLYPAGYSAVLFDFRAHGWSGGRRTSFGAPGGETDDLKAVLRWIESRADLRDLPRLALGESMGAAVSLLTAADEPDILAVVADSAYARFDSAVSGRLALAFGQTLGKLLTPPAQRIGEKMLGTPCADIAPVEAIGRIAPRPLLLIHGSLDRLIPPENALLLHRAAGPNAALWIVDGARHVQSVHVAPDYGARVIAFLDTALSDGVQRPNRQIRHTVPEQTPPVAR